MAFFALSELKTGESAAVKRLCAVGAMRRRLLDVGLCEGTRVTCLGKSPLGDPAAYLIRGAVIAIRAVDGQNVIVGGD